MYCIADWNELRDKPIDELDWDVDVMECPEIEDDEDLFLPLLYKKTTGTASDHFLGIWGTKYLGKHTYIIRFPDYEIRIIANTKNSNNDNMMKFHKSCFNKNKILIPLVEKKTPMDIQLTRSFIDCRNNTHFKNLK